MCLSQALPIAADVASVASGNPELMLAAAATTAGNYIQTQNNNASVDAQYKARDAALRQGVQAQDVLAANNQNVLDSATAKFTPGSQNDSLGDLVTTRQNTIANNVNNTVPSSFVDPTKNANAPQVVNDSLAQKMGNATAYANQQGKALGTLGGLSDQNVANSLTLNTSGNQIGMNDAIAKGQAVASQAETNAAYNNARKSPSVLGNVLSTAGTLAGLDAFTGGANSFGNQQLSNVGNYVVGNPPGTDTAFNTWLNTNTSPAALSKPISPYDQGI